MEISEVYKRKKSLKSIFRFIEEIKRSEKMNELISFLIWEIKYRLFMYGKDQKLTFTNKNVLRSINDEMEMEDIKTDRYSVSNSKSNWIFIFFDSLGYSYRIKFGSDNVLHRFSPDNNKLSSYEFKHNIIGLFVAKNGTVYCSSNGVVYRSDDDISTFNEAFQFTTNESFFRQESITETPNGDIFIGEYGNIITDGKWLFIGYIYHSQDKGKSWTKLDFLEDAGINKHVHIVKWSHTFNGLILADGDNQKNVWINKSKSYNKISEDAEHGWKKINKNHIQKGGYTGIKELNGKIFLGTDYQGGTNFLVSSTDMIDFQEKVIPDPYRRGISDRIVIRKNQDGTNELWATLYFKHGKKNKSLVMVSFDNGDSWEKVIEYCGNRFEIRIICDTLTILEEVYLLIKDKARNEYRTLCVHS